MIIRNTKPEQIENVELADIVRKLRRLSDGGYDLLDNNHETIVRLLKRALKLAKQEKEWDVYFEGLEDIIYQYQRASDILEIVKWAEIFYRDSALYMDNALPNYPNSRLGYYNTFTYELIFNAYRDSCEIDDAKMDVFMKQYEENAIKYGKTYNYYGSEMQLGLLYRDVDMVRHGAQHFEKYEHELDGCYICGHEQYLGHYLLLGNRQGAEELMLDFIHRRIPQRHLWCYNYCEAAQPQNLYVRILWYCMRLGKAEDFQYFYKKYWLGLPIESRRTGNWTALSRHLCAVARDFNELETDLGKAEEDVKNAARNSTMDNVENCLSWWRYFALLDKSGVHELAIDLPELQKDADGKAPTLAVSCYFEKRADEYGMRFAQVRKKYDYQFVKESYRACARA